MKLLLRFLHAVFSELIKRNGFLFKVRLRMRGVVKVDNLDRFDANVAEIMRNNTELTFQKLQAIRGMYLNCAVKLPQDPFSDEYRKSQMDLYKKLTKKEYSAGNEIIEYVFSGDHTKIYPYSSGSPEEVGMMLLNHGFILKNFKALPQGSRIVEFGTGWGNFTLNMLQMGYRVTAVEVNRSFLDLLEHRAREFKPNLNVRNQDMIDFCEENKEEFDAVVFNAAFHHCSDHRRLLDGIGRWLSKNGVIYFCSEPVFFSKNAYLPYPWGLRMDGESMYMIRSQGWLELGFQFTYLKKILAMRKFSFQRVGSAELNAGDLYIARRICT